MGVMDTAFDRATVSTLPPIQHETPTDSQKLGQPSYKMGNLVYDISSTSSEDRIHATLTCVDASQLFCPTPRPA